jgi:predicted dinucleotide-binding enzyme
VLIGTIGAGHIGGTLARLFVEAGHTVAVSNSRGPASLVELVDELGRQASAVTVEDAARYGEIVVVSIPFGRYRDVPREQLAGKVVIDTNNYYPQRDGNFDELDDGTLTSSELLQAHLVDARVVKALNTLNWQKLQTFARLPGHPERVAVPIAGDDAAAKNAASHLIDDIGFDAVDAGPLARGRLLQPGTDVYGAVVPADEMRAQLGL